MRVLLWRAERAHRLVGVYKRFFHSEIINFIYQQSRISIRASDLAAGSSGSHQHSLLRLFSPRSRIKSIDLIETKVRNGLVPTRLKKTHPTTPTAGYYWRDSGSVGLVIPPP